MADNKKKKSKKKKKETKPGSGKFFGPDAVFGDPMDQSLTFFVTTKQLAAIKKAAAELAEQTGDSPSVSKWLRKAVLAVLPPEVAEVSKQSE